MRRHECGVCGDKAPQGLDEIDLRRVGWRQYNESTWLCVRCARLQGRACEARR